MKDMKDEDFTSCSGGRISPDIEVNGRNYPVYSPLNITAFRKEGKV